MTENDDELNEFIDEVTDGSYILALCRGDLQACQSDTDMVFVWIHILFTIYFLGYLSTVCFVQVRKQ